MLPFHNFHTKPKGEIIGNGIFQKLKDIFHVSDIYKSIITLSASGSNDPQNHPLNFVLFPETSYWVSLGTEGQYIQIGFYQNRVILSDIQIKTAYCDLFLTYTFYGLNNGEESVEIGTRSIKTEDYINVGDSIVSYTFPINNKNAFNSIKIVGNGKRAAQDYLLIFHLLELHGQFLSNNYYITCQKHYNRPNLIFFIYYLIIK